MVASVPPSYPVDDRNTVRRRPDRGAYDRPTVHALLDSSMLCHIAYVMDGQPFCTPTFFWREGNHIYWHGSAISRMLKHEAEGVAVCLTVTHLDSLVLARCGFNHSADYRSVMVFGTAHIVTDPAAKLAALRHVVDRFFPDRTDALRISTRQEIAATTVIGMEIEQASAKIRAKGVADDEEDYALPIYAERIAVRTVIGEIDPCPRLLDGVTRPTTLNGYQTGRTLEDALVEAHRITFPFTRLDDVADECRRAD
jgi:uncharacterized protein